jgi:hypothetical protein
MPISSDARTVDFGGPATYRIVVQGWLSEPSRRRFAGMTVESVQDDRETPRTTLVGHVRDQAELRGVLDALYGLHLTVVNVEQCNGG